MHQDTRRRFTDTVAACTPTMIGLAYLFTGRQAAAERLLRRALARTARRWRHAAAEPERYILRSMCRTVVGWRYRLREDPPASPPSRGGGPRLQRAMRRAYPSLPTAERVVIALQHHQGLTEAEIADLLGWPARRVRRRAERAVVRLRESLAEVAS